MLILMVLIIKYIFLLWCHASEVGLRQVGQSGRSWKDKCLILSRFKPFDNSAATDTEIHSEKAIFKYFSTFYLTIEYSLREFVGYFSEL